MSWKLICDRGRQIWQWICSETSPSIEYDPTNENSSDRIFREEFYRKNFQKLKVNIDETKEDASLSLNQRIFDAINYFQSLQSDDGHWPGDYGGPMFLLPGAIFTSYVTKFQFKDEEKSEMIRYLFHHQLDDGGWGTHIQSSSTMFGTVLNYISLRILGIPSNDHRMIKASDLIKREGGAMYAPSWAKFWLCVLGLIPWNGINCLLPELWLLPVWLPFHPSRYWCHARMVYLSMSYIYSEKIVAHSSSLIEDLKKELFIEENYQQIDFSQHRNSISPLDLYSPQTHLLKLIHRFLNFYEMIHLKSFRVKSSEYLFQLIRGEDEQTDYIDIGPVNKFLNMISIYHHDGRESETFAKHLHRVQDYLWLSEDGMKLQGYNGSQLWDTAFTIQSIIETGFDHYFSRSLQLASNYLEMSQVLEDVHQYQWYFRHPSRGGWPFSTRDHGWPITDCTAEAIKAVLLLKEKNHLQDDLIHQERIEWGIDFILSCQNKDGGWATYELQRTSKYLEWLNPSEVFYGIMIDYSYVECTSACVQALNRFRSSSNYRRREIDLSIERGLNFIRKQQRKDGSWYGSWAICFTYGTWFAIEALITLGESPQSPTIQKAIQFLLSKQNVDGGWGESYLSCVHKCYVPHQQSQIVNTSWAVLTLIQAQADPTAIEKGIEYLLRQQSSNGDWIQQSISGVFNGNCMISYTNYRNIFPIWALGRYRTVFLKKK